LLMQAARQGVRACRHLEVALPTTARSRWRVPDHPGRDKRRRGRLVPRRPVTSIYEMEVSNMSISRQDWETDLTELHGAVCDRLLAVPGKAPDFVIVLYLLADGVWYRFFLDAHLLFLDEGLGPDPEDDLGEAESYLDLSSRLPCSGGRIEEFAMRDGTLSVRFSTGASLILREEDGGTRVSSRS
jgi:hypothetical protein